MNPDASCAGLSERQPFCQLTVRGQNIGMAVTVTAQHNRFIGMPILKKSLNR